MVLQSVASQQEGSWFESQLGQGLSLWSLHVLHSEFSHVLYMFPVGTLASFEDMQIRVNPPPPSRPSKDKRYR